jgi:hypothetical protein
VSPRGNVLRLLRKASAEIIRNKLPSPEDELRKRMHLQIENVAVWYEKIVNIFYDYYAIHDNSRVMFSCHYHLSVIWC